MLLCAFLFALCIFFACYSTFTKDSPSIFSQKQNVLKSVNKTHSLFSQKQSGDTLTESESKMYPVNAVCLHTFHKRSGRCCRSTICFALLITYYGDLLPFESANAFVIFFCLCALCGQSFPSGVCLFDRRFGGFLLHFSYLPCSYPFWRRRLLLLVCVCLLTFGGKKGGTRLERMVPGFECKTEVGVPCDGFHITRINKSD